jgi:hypothetical protein
MLKKRSSNLPMNLASASYVLGSARDPRAVVGDSPTIFLSIPKHFGESPKRAREIACAPQSICLLARLAQRKLNL